MKTERVFFILIIIVLLMRYAFLMPLTGIMLMLVCLTLSLIFFPGGIYFFYDEEFRKQKIWLSLLSGLLLSTAPLAVLAKLMFWSDDYTTTGIALLFCLMALMLSILYQRNQKPEEKLSTYYRHMVIRAWITTSFVLLTFLIPTTVLIRIQFRFDPELVRLQTQVYEHPENELYWKELEHYQQQRAE